MDLEPSDPCQICGNVLKTTFVAICGDIRHSLCGNCYNQTNGKCPSCRYVSKEFNKLVNEEVPTYLDANKLIMFQNNDRIYTALIKEDHKDNNERTALNIYDLARYYTRTIQDGSDAETINPNFCGESITDIKIYISPGVKKCKELKTAKRVIHEQLFTLF